MLFALLVTMEILISQCMELKFHLTWYQLKCWIMSTSCAGLDVTEKPESQFLQLVS